MCLPVYVRDEYIKNCKKSMGICFVQICFIIKHFQAGLIKHKQNFDDQGSCNALVVDKYLVCFGFPQQGMWCWEAYL